MSSWREALSGYYGQESSHYGPQRVQRSRLHQTALSAPAPYAGGVRPLMHDPLLPSSSWNEPAPSSSQLYQDFNAPKKVHRLQVSFQAKSTEAEVNWLHPPVPKSTAYTYSVTVEGAQNNQNLTFPQWRTYMRMKVTPGTWYKVEVKAMVDSGMIGYGVVEFKSVFDREELIKLHRKAVDFIGDRIEPFEVVYRHKPGPYWENIRRNRDGIMEKYIKDMNGQPATPINDVIYGLFFSATHFMGVLPPTSPFGDVRLIIPAEKLLNPNHNFYFADFYCNYSKHYVTIVVCIAGSDTDRYCSKALLPLDPRRNPFLMRYEHPGWLEFGINMSQSVWVEIFYTESIPIDIGCFEKAKGLGRSKPGGLPNNKQCIHCNLYPAINRSDQDSRENLNPDTMKRGREDDSFEDFRTKKKPLDQLTLDEEEEKLNELDFNSTFHLAMELERERVKQGDFALGEFDIVEAVCSLVDETVIEVGATIEVPDHGFVGEPLDPTKVLFPESAASDSTNDDNSTEAKESETAQETLDRHEKAMKSDEGKDAMKSVMTHKVDLDKKLTDIQKMIASIESAVSTLDKKLLAIK